MDTNTTVDVRIEEYDGARAELRGLFALAEDPIGIDGMELRDRVRLDLATGMTSGGGR